MIEIIKIILPRKELILDYELDLKLLLQQQIDWYSNL